MSIEMTPERWEHTCGYLRAVFGTQDDHLAGLMDRAVEAGLPDIAISADVGRMLMLLTSMTRAQLAVEVGTLAGYSGIWIARGLKPGGKLITIELEDRHADFAQAQFETAGVADRVELRRGGAEAVLDQLAKELPAGTVDVAFLDADKAAYPGYWTQLRPLIAPGGLLLADNMLGGGSWWIDEKPGANASRDAADAVNRMLAADPEFTAVTVPIREGVLVARRNEA
jgi:caffeoyl-CoA O-methyltransferase